jgi:hypothetical protein
LLAAPTAENSIEGTPKAFFVANENFSEAESERAGSARAAAGSAEGASGNVLLLLKTGALDGTGALGSASVWAAGSAVTVSCALASEVLHRQNIQRQNKTQSVEKSREQVRMRQQVRCVFFKDSEFINFPPCISYGMRGFVPI